MAFIKCLTNSPDDIIKSEFDQLDSIKAKLNPLYSCKGIVTRNIYNFNNIYSTRYDF